MTAEGLHVLAVDDELPALEDLARLLRVSPQVRRVDAATSASAALARLAENGYDCLFLDVRMPDVDGIELTRVLRRFARPPAVVFVTAYEDAAVDAFALRAVDYLMKPVSRRRIEEALDRARDAAPPPAPPRAPTYGMAPPPEGGHDVVPAHNLRGGGTRLVARGSILYIESSGDYVRLVCDDGRYLLRGQISDLEQRWASLGFVRIHRRYLANLRRAIELLPNVNGTASLVFPDGVAVPVSRRQVPELMRKLAL